ncbi:GT2 family glycosyltransferase [Salipiger aestuarii]|uniref:GT2 family glycosyltransferase n=2 Tax=Salipiger aestuarii TaxID=568098 RepID=A0A327XTG0_9RHOB|nr:glycosyltransferase family 2 protein [Salipiger aestuarii]RAK09289.1 GT2 family glycosyltransferase [Salipiger aestuarii]
MSTSQRTLAAVVVTFNRLDKLKDTVAALLASPPEHLHHLLVVDNASTDGTAAWLAGQSDPRLEALELPTNTGGAGGFEAGMRKLVQDHDPDWIAVMDDDGRPAPDALGMFHASRPEDWDAVVSAVRYPDGRICPFNRPGMNPFGGGRKPLHLGPETYDGPPRAVEVASFVGVFVSRRAIRTVGYPDGGLFVYGDDHMYTLRITQAGLRMGFVPQIRFDHDCATFAGLEGRLQPIWKVYYYHRNLMLFYRQAAGPKFWFLLGPIVAKWALKTRFYRGQRRMFARLMARAVRDALRRRTGTDHAALLAKTQASDLKKGR